MAQMTWRSSDELHERIRSAAAQHGRSMNEFVTLVLDAATDPELAGSDAGRLRERLDRAGILIPAGLPRRRPDPDQVRAARVRAGAGAALSRLVNEGR
ncbi:MAG: FitA-like ribbon-helix-helix domain-containing protein [Acidimicrobiales bacterium]